MTASQAADSTVVDVLLTLENPASAAFIQKAIDSYRSGYLVDEQDGLFFNRIEYPGLQEPTHRYLLRFIAPGHDFKATSDSVHQFMHSFMDDFFDEELEEDWLCELDCDELPSFIEYEVLAACAYEPPPQTLPGRKPGENRRCGDCVKFDRYKDADDGYGGCAASCAAGCATVHEDYEAGECEYFS